MHLETAKLTCFNNAKRQRGKPQEQLRENQF